MAIQGIDCHCAETALSACGDLVDRWESAFTDLAFRALISVIGGGEVSTWNDRSTHAEVVAGFDRALASLQ